MSYKPMDRRTFLRGAGITIALPFLEAMLPIRVLASTPGAPQRFVAIMFANGTVWADDTGSNFRCDGSGTNWTFGRSLREPLTPYKNLITPINGLRNEAYAYFRANFDNTIAHWATACTYLTGQPTDYPNRRVPGVGLRLLNSGASVDQMIAAKTPNAIKSLVMGPEAANGVFNEPSYGSEHMVTQISYSSQTEQPNRLDNSLAVFNQLFSSGGGTLPPTGQGTNTLAQKRKSIIDLVKNDTDTLLRKISTRDKVKMDEFFTSLREIEKSVTAEISMSSTGSTGGSCKPADPKYTADTDAKNGALYFQRTHNMLDMLAIAFQCDLTRVSSFQINNENTVFNIAYYGPGSPDGAHHNIGHYRDAGDGSSGNPIQYRIDLMDFKVNWEAKQLAYLINKLSTTSDANGSLIDNTLILYGCGFSDSTRHNADNLPILLAGRGVGHNPGTMINAPGVNHANLLAAIANKFGAGSAVGMSNGLMSGI